VISELRQHAREDLQAQVLLIPQAVGSSLKDTDLVVEAFNKAERDLVLWLAVSSDPRPVLVNHLGKLLVRLEPLPLERVAPLLEEAACPALGLVIPELTERLLEQVGRVESFVWL